MGNDRQRSVFYQFLGSHSLLIGLLPFYLPVFLWQRGFDLADITLLIGVSGLSFCVALHLWQIASKQLNLGALLSLTFALECLLVASAFFASNAFFIVLALGICNGFYNCFFWTTQRTLFLQLLGENDAGKRYGNFQIFVTVFLKIGILIGGWLLSAGGLPWLLAASVVISAFSSWWFWQKASKKPLHQSTHVHFFAALRYNDKHRSRPVFVADGFFLFLESHYWTLSLFLLANENFARLGVIVVVLALLFAALFYLIKNSIDTLAVSVVYRFAVILYALSWVLRCFVDNELSSILLLLLLLSITFCSSFFRLAFNKRFFDIAQANSGISYLVIKSYQSQFILGIGFMLIALLLQFNGQTSAASLTPLYAVFALGSLSYWLYRR